MTPSVINLPKGFPAATAAGLVKANPGTLFIAHPDDAGPAPVDHSKDAIATVAKLVLTGIAGYITGPLAPLVAIVANVGGAGIEAWLTGTTKERHTLAEIEAAGAAVVDPQT